MRNRRPPGARLSSRTTSWQPCPAARGRSRCSARTATWTLSRCPRGSAFRSMSPRKTWVVSLSPASCLQSLFLRCPRGLSACVGASGGSPFSESVGMSERSSPVFARCANMIKKGRLLRLRNADRRCVFRLLALGLIPARIAHVFCRLTRRWRGAPSSRSPTARPSRVSPGLSCLPALAGLPTSGFSFVRRFFAFFFPCVTVPVSGARGSRRPWRPDRVSIFRDMPRSVN